MPRFSKKTLLHHLEQLETEELREEVIRLYDKFNQVKEYYQSELSEGENPLLESYKKRIRSAYFPKTGKGRRKNSRVRKLLGEYKKVAVFDYDMIDLLLFRVECGVEYATEFREKKERIYTAIIGSFEEAVLLMKASPIHENFVVRCEQIIAKAPSDLYGFKEKLAEIHPEEEKHSIKTP